MTISLSRLTRRTQLSCPTVIECLARLEDLGLVVSTTREPGKVKTYYVADPTAAVPPSVFSTSRVRGRWGRDAPQADRRH